MKKNRIALSFVFLAVLSLSLCFTSCATPYKGGHPAHAKMCRIAWESQVTKFTGHGNWFPISEERNLFEAMYYRQSEYPVKYHMEYK